MITLRGLVMILELHQQGLSVSAIAARTGVDRKTVRKYIARGLEPPVYGPRLPRARLLEPYEQFVRARLAAFPELSIPRLLREIRPQGYGGGLTVLLDRLLHHAIVIPIEGSSYRLREHAQLLPEHMRTHQPVTATDQPPARRRGRPPKGA